MGLAGVCLALVTAAGVSAGHPVFVPVERFTLAWMHSIEKVRWEEDYAVVPGKTPGSAPALQALAARVHGSGAGMEPPADARLHDGWYEYTPRIQTPAELRLTRSAYTADYEWCAQGRCRPLSELLPSDGSVTLLTACRRPPAAAAGLSNLLQALDLPLRQVLNLGDVSRR